MSQMVGMYGTGVINRLTRDAIGTNEDTVGQKVLRQTMCSSSPNDGVTMVSHPGSLKTSNMTQAWIQMSTENPNGTGITIVRPIK